MKLEPIFRDIEAESRNYGVRGTFQRRLLTDSQCDLFVGVELPGGERIFRTRFSRDALTLDAFEIALTGIEIKIGDVHEDAKDFVNIRLKLLNVAFLELFTNLAEDIEQHVAAMPDEKAASEAFVSRLNMWRKFFERHAPDGLSPERQRGLYGELRFLADTVLSCLSPEAAVSSWTGPDGAARDFQFTSGVACEIKTSTSGPPYRVHINGEAQLDDFGLSHLYLDCQFVEERRSTDTGTSLPDQVAAIRGLLAASHESANLFEDRLLQAGYLDMHTDKYRPIVYVDRTSLSFRVSGGFPRITSGVLPTGIGGVKYVLGLDACADYSIDRTAIKSRLKEQ